MNGARNDDSLFRPAGRRLAARLAVALAALLLAASGARASEVAVAVAVNFAEPLEAIAAAFQEETGHVVRPSSGSSGKLYAQIRNGAPYDVFLSADQERPRRLEAEGAAVPGSRFTYAVGRLALWSPDPDRIDGVGTLRRGDFRFLAIAAPELAPYGEAAKQTLEALGLWAAMQDRLVRGENIAQTFQFVATGNAQLGFVAVSQLVSPRHALRGSRWDVPPHLHEPIRQDAVLLARAADDPAARAFLAFLRGPRAQAIVERFGYDAGR